MDKNRSNSYSEDADGGHPAETVPSGDYLSAPLPAGTRLENLKIGELICSSFSGFSYTAVDVDQQRPLVVQEYFPEEITVRDLDRVSLMLRDETVSNEFEFGLSRFLRLAKTLSRIDGKGKVVSYIEANDTSYYVSTFDYRCSFRHLVESGKRVPGQNVDNWLKSCLRFLLRPHEANLLHLNIQADSILIDTAGEAIMTGFNSVGPSFNTEPSAPEYLYLPIERIHSQAEMLPASDLYSLAAVLIHGMSGQIPAHAARRSGAVSAGRPDPMEEQFAALAENIRPELLRVLRWMMAPQPKQRPQSAAEVLSALDPNEPKPIPVIRKVAPPAKPASPAKHEVGKRPAVTPFDGVSAKDTPSQPAKPTADAPSGQREDPGAPRESAADMPRQPENWFEGEETGRFSGRSLPGAIAGHPATWVLLVIVAVVAAWLWLGEDDGPGPEDASVESAPRINVVTGNEPVTREPVAPADVTLEPAARITASADSERARRLQRLDALERQLEPHFMEAEAHLGNGRLVTPEGANALQSYRTVLEIDADNQRAIEAIAAIEDRLLIRATAAIEAGDVETAEREVANLAIANPGHAGIDDIGSRIAEIRLQREREAEAARLQAEREAREREAAEARQRQLQELLASAVTSYDSGRLVEPPLDNALYYYREMLKVDPSSVAAAAGIEQIAASYVRLSRQALASTDLDLADRNLTTAAAIDPANRDIPVIREQIDTSRRLAEQETRALAEAERNRQMAQNAAQSRSQLSLESGVQAYYRGDYQESFNFLRPLAEEGHPRAQFRVAQMYHHGRGTEVNRAEARKWFLAAIEPIRAAAADGVAWAQADMGSYFEDGVIIDTNHAEAASWYMRAAEQGYAGAQTNLGVLYANGQGVEPDMRQAVEWFKRAAIQGDSVAKENLRILGIDPNRIVLGQ